MKIRQHAKRLMALFLAFIMMFAIVPTNVLAAIAGRDGFPVIMDTAGNIISIDESWDESFPFGAFAFADSQLAIEEGNDGIITVYRLGGTAGRAHVFITYTPIVAMLNENQPTFSLAAGANDISIRVEDTLPIAFFQPIGEEKQPERSERTIDIVFNDTLVTLFNQNPDAHDFQWYILRDGAWIVTENGNSAEIIITHESFNQYDFRLRYFVGDNQFITASVRGIPFISSVLQQTYSHQHSELYNALSDGDEYYVYLDRYQLHDESEGLLFAEQLLEFNFHVQTTSPSALSIGIFVDGHTDEDVVLNFDEASVDWLQWYVMFNGIWHRVTGAVYGEFPLYLEDFYSYDFRVVYSISGILYATDSIRGEIFTPRPTQELPSIPPDMVFDVTQSFTQLPLDTEDEFAGIVFEMIFADGEYRKEIHISALYQDQPKPDRFGVFQIVDHIGGTVLESANMLTLQVISTAESSETNIGFEFEYVTADKANGEVRLLVIRTGCMLDMLVVDYRTTDCNAIAGRDYANTRGRMVFFGDIDRHEIVVPLINDGIENHEAISFYVYLDSLLGDGLGLATLLPYSVRVDVINTTVAQPFLANVANIADVSMHINTPQVPIARINAPTIRAAQNQAQDDVVQIDAFGVGFAPFHWDFRDDDENDNSPYSILNFASEGRWRRYSTLIGAPITYWANDNNTSRETISSGDVPWEARGRRDSQGERIIKHMATMYSSITARFNWRAAPTGWLRDQHIRPDAFIRTSGNPRFIHLANPRVNVNHPVFGSTSARMAQYHSNHTNSAWSMTSGVDGIRMQTRNDGGSRNGERDAYARLLDAVLTRRNFEHGMQLRVHTANDGINIPESSNIAAFRTGVDYRGLRPRVSINNGNGGTVDGRALFVGSQLQVSNIPSGFTLPQSTTGNLSYGIFLTNVRTGAIVQPNGLTVNNDVATFAMNWTGINEAALSERYILNIILERRQDLEIELRMSIPRYDNSFDINPARANEARDTFEAVGSYITIGYQPMGNRVSPHTGGVQTRVIPKSALVWYEGTALRVPGNLLPSNIQWIELNLDPEDRILGNQSHAGDERIYLSVADLARETLSFRYVSEEFRSVPGPMNVTIDRATLYLDANGNGRIDGYFCRRLGRFVLTPDENGIYDLRIGAISPNVAINEVNIAPIQTVDALGNITFHHFHIKTYISMDPRSYEAPPHVDVDNTFAQIIPAFVTSLADTGGLTVEQQVYNYVFTGQHRSCAWDGSSAFCDFDNTTPYNYSSDNRFMFGAPAAVMTMLDIPLGGDHNPTHRDAMGVFVWEPNFVGGLLFPHDEPEQIFIAESLAGADIPVGGSNSDRNRLNGYLGSFVAHTMITLNVREQTTTLAEHRIYGEYSGLERGAETSTQSGWRAIPNPDHLANMQSAGEQPPMDSPDMGGAQNPFPEINVGFGFDMPDLDFGANPTSPGARNAGMEVSLFDFATISISDTMVAISVGIPLPTPNDRKRETTANRDTDGNWATERGKWKAGSSSQQGNIMAVETFVYGVRAGYSVPSLNQLNRAFDELDNIDNLRGGKGKISSQKFSVSLNMQIGVIFRFDEARNQFSFSQASIAVTGTLEFKFNKRFIKFPPLYIFLKVKVELEVSTGLTVDREIRERPNARSLVSNEFIPAGQTRRIPIDYRAVNIVFDGTAEISSTIPYSMTRRVNSTLTTADGKTNTRSFVLSSRYPNERLSQRRYLEITAITDITVSSIREAIHSDSRVLWNGIRLAPSVFVEFGAGLGVPLFNVELFINVKVSASFQFGAMYLHYTGNANVVGHWDTRINPARVEEFKVTAGVGLRVTLLFFSFSIDAVRFTLKYDGDKSPGDRWSTQWSAFGVPLGRAGAIGSGSGPRLMMPQMPSTTLTTHSAEFNAGGYQSFAPLAFTPVGRDVPFQLSRHANNSGDAFSLITGGHLGFDSRVVYVNGRNYLIYTFGRTNVANAIDATHLYMSQILVAPSTESYGLVHPAFGRIENIEYEHEDPFSPLNAPNRIPIDIGESGIDMAGDLDFDVWVSGYYIYVAWVSYAEPLKSVPEPVEPSEEFDADMTIYNFESFNPESERPDVVTMPTHPDFSQFGIEDLDDCNCALPIEDCEHVAFTNPLNDDETRYMTPDEIIAFEFLVDFYLNERALYEDFLGELYLFNARLELFTLWQTYFLTHISRNRYYQYLLTNTAANTEIRQARFNVIDGTEFSTHEAVGPASDDGDIWQNFSPRGASGGSTVFYARAMMPDAIWLAEQDAAFNEYLLTIHPNTGDFQMDVFSRDVRDFRHMIQRSTRELFGYQNYLRAIIEGNAIPLAIPHGQIIDSLEVSFSNGIYYVAFITTEDELLHNNTTQRVTRRLHLTTFNPSTSVNGAWGEVMLLRTIRDYDENYVGGQLRDGVYSGGAIVERIADPHFGNLNFLHGRLGEMTGVWEGFPVAFTPFSAQAIVSENFMLFDMNGSTYIIPYASLRSIVAREGGYIIPFFTPPYTEQADGTFARDYTTGRTNVTIGADGAGNIAAIYTHAVPSTMNNAIFLTMFDPYILEWGVGTMLAMQDMDVHESSIREGWSQEYTERAFLANYETFSFDNLQMAFGRPRQYEDGVVSDAGSVLLITQGTLTQLEVFEGLEGLEVMPRRDFDHNGDLILPAVGTFALSFDAGTTGIGEDFLVFIENNFSGQNPITFAFGFTNTGTRAIRGTPSTPITAHLRLMGAPGQTTLDAGVIASFNIYENILSGQDVLLGGSAILTGLIPGGSYFYIAIEEHYTITERLSASTLLIEDSQVIGYTFAVLDAPDLGFEHFSLTGMGINDNGMAIVEVDMLISNRGSIVANDVFVQFSYEHSRNQETGETIFMPLDITTAELNTGLQIPLARFLAFNTDDLARRRNGEYVLQDSFGQGSISPNYGRRVTGQIFVSDDVFRSLATGSLHLRVELFTGDDVQGIISDGIIQLIYSPEQNRANNVRSSHIDHFTAFTAARNLTLTPGNTMRLPVRISSTTDVAPFIVAEEIGNDTDSERNLGVLNFIPGEFVNGQMTGTLVIAPSTDEMATGRIHLRDVNTNSLHIINYRIRDFGEGIDIFRDNEFFRFYNRDVVIGGVVIPERFDERAPRATQRWHFDTFAPTWGRTVGDQPMQNNPPLNNQLAIGQRDAYFIFTSVAESIQFYFQGEIEITSDITNPRVFTLPGPDGLIYVDVFFGENPNNLPFEVKVRVLSPTAIFDRIIERYAGGQLPLPRHELFAPHILWSRNFPTSGEVADGTNLDFTLYVLSSGGIGSVIIGGEPRFGFADTDRLLPFTQRFNANIPQTFTAVATSLGGERVVSGVFVDWFEENPIGTNGDVPILDVFFTLNEDTARLEVDGYWQPSGRDNVFLNVNVAYAHSIIKSMVVYAITFDDDGNIVRSSINQADGRDGVFNIRNNGIFEVYVTAQDGTWARTIIEMRRIDASIPIVNLIFRNNEDDRFSGFLEWSARKDPVDLHSPLNGIMLSDINVDRVYHNPVGSRIADGIIAVHFSGRYVLEVEDTVGNTNSVFVDVRDLPINLGDPDAVFVINAWQQSRDNGAVSIDYSNITGGHFDPDALMNRRVLIGQYQHALIPRNEAMLSTQSGFYSWMTQILADDGLWIDARDSHIGLPPGEYMLFVRDALDSLNVSVIAYQHIVVLDTAIDFDTLVQRANAAFDADVTARGGKFMTGLYEFAILPQLYLDTPMVAIHELENYGAVWQIGNNPLYHQNIFSSINAGTHQVAVRELMLSEAEYHAFRTAQGNLLDARVRHNAAIEALTPDALENAILDYAQLILAQLDLWRDYPTVENERSFFELIENDATVIATLSSWDSARVTGDEELIDVTYSTFVNAVMTLAERVAASAIDDELMDAQNNLALSEIAFNDLLPLLGASSSGIYTANPEFWFNAKTDVVEALPTTGVMRVSITSELVPGGPRQPPGTRFVIQFVGVNFGPGSTVEFHKAGANRTAQYIGNGVLEWSGVLVGIAEGSTFNVESVRHNNQVADLIFVDAVVSGRRIFDVKTSNSITLTHFQFGDVRGN
ncbi:MAG: hypothetical protein FWC16_03890 [Defluviitaleaceae bacterium]|nr:hypothetical protein [Defluviitaleaceae bacterium]MCL2274046.1 hypothetical protein [Defluviitaleaceae bacterium]